MTIITIICNLSKFEPSNDKWEYPLKGRQGQTFKLLPKHPIHKHVFTLDINNYLTNIDTDFILDMDTNCIITFDVDTLVPTAEDLYEAYVQANTKSNFEIMQRAEKEGINIDVTAEQASFETMKDGLNKCIEKMLMV